MKSTRQTNDQVFNQDYMHRKNLTVSSRMVNNTNLSPLINSVI